MNKQSKIIYIIMLLFSSAIAMEQNKQIEKEINEKNNVQLNGLKIYAEGSRLFLDFTGLSNDVQEIISEYADEWVAEKDLGNGSKLAYSKDGKRLYSILGNNFLMVWNPIKSKLIKIINLPDLRRIGSVSFSSNLNVSPKAFSGKVAFSAHCEGTIEIYDAKTSKFSKINTDHHNWIDSISLSCDGKQIASSGFSETAVKIWDTESGKLIYNLEHSNSSQSIKYSPDSKYLACGGMGAESLNIWDCATGKLFKQFEEKGRHQNIAYSSDGKKIASHNCLGIIRIWDTESGLLIICIIPERSKNNNLYIGSLVFNYAGNQIAFTYDSNLEIWDVTTAKQIYNLAFDNRISSIIFSPNGNQLAISFMDNDLIKLYKRRANDLLLEE